jgi:NADPH-dependent 2,4-dienoyl-CoA reductase/sulfur reductase-like enzyme
MENIQGHEMLNLRKVYPDAERDVEPATDIGLAKNRQYRDYIQAKKGTTPKPNGHVPGKIDTANREDEVRRVDAIVVGAGQAGLSAAGYLKALELDAVVVEKNKEIGDNWTNRYESLYLHTPHRFSMSFRLVDGLQGIKAD